ncbi:MAG TPA: hypothetical protein VHQ65_06185, partial [Thermoanaerobaculia bacterium]|nr:hypothetical protein [Thermoanaerobaculia bacterium]
DLLGRLDWVVTAAGGGDRAAGEGAAVAAAWRTAADDALPGSPPAGLVDWRLHLFLAEEEPSLALAGLDLPGVRDGFDVERRGVEVSAGWQRRASTAGGLLRFAVGAYAGRAEPAPSPRFAASYDEQSLFAEGLWQPRASIGEWRGGVDLTGRLDHGSTGDLDWQRLRGGGGAFLGRGDITLDLSWHHGEIDQGDVPWQLFQVGGTPGSLLPSTVEAARVLVPALPAATFVGKRFDAQRVGLTGLLPLPLFYARYRAGDGEWLDMAGLEWRGRLGPVPLLRLPELELTLGVAQLLDPPFEDDTEWWAALAWRP